jgi:hypothetical protein
MFKNKKNIKILLPVVIIIWGLLIYKIVGAINPDEISLSSTPKTTFKAPTIQEKETFELIAIESDPFLGTMYNKPKTQKITSKSNRTDIVWPTIKYQGIVSDKNAKSSVYILNINGKQYLVKKGDTLLKIKVLKSTLESIRLRYKGQTKEFPIM